MTLGACLLCLFFSHLPNVRLMAVYTLKSHAFHMEIVFPGLKDFHLLMTRQACIGAGHQLGMGLVTLIAIKLHRGIPGYVYFCSFFYYCLRRPIMRNVHGSICY